MAERITSLGDLTPDPKNARQHTPRNIGLIAASLQEVGFARSIVVDEDGVVLAGNGVVEAAGQVGMEAVRVVDASGDELVVVRRSGLTPAQKTRLALFDNRATDLSSFDGAVLATLDPPLLEGLWRPDELAALTGAEPLDPAALWAGMPEFEQADQESWKHLIVHFENADDYQAFAALVGQTLTDKTKYIYYPTQQKLNLKDYRVEDES